LNVLNSIDALAGMTYKLVRQTNCVLVDVMGESLWPNIRSIGVLDRAVVLAADPALRVAHARSEQPA